MAAEAEEIEIEVIRRSPPRPVDQVGSAHTASISHEELFERWLETETTSATNGRQQKSHRADSTRQLPQNKSGNSVYHEESDYELARRLQLEEHQRAAVIERERASRKTEQQGASSGAESTSGKSPTVETEDLGDLVWLGRDGLLVVDEEATKSVKTLSTIIKVIAFLIMAAGIACMLTPFQCFSAALAVGVGHFYAATLRNIEALQVVSWIGGVCIVIATIASVLGVVFNKDFAASFPRLPSSFQFAVTGNIVPFTCVGITVVLIICNCFLIFALTSTVKRRSSPEVTLLNEGRKRD